MKKFPGFITASLVLSFFLLFPISAWAYPMLGVIDTELLVTWDGSDGPFQFPDGGNITVWWGSDSGSIPENANVRIATTAGPDFTFTVGGTTYTLDEEIYEKIDGYPYGDAGAGIQAWAANLGSLNSNSLWEEATDATAPALVEGENMAFYLLNGTFDGGPFPADGFWIFAWADIDLDDEFDGNPRDRFAPKTTSTIPEPSTLLLVGSGLALLGLWGRRRFGAVK